ncbi:MAG: FAD-binding oxidoreductase [Acidobacteria bacterium]|nr:FAD-binding oxidoreductase [Acidobacteriota bacterium]
MDPQKTDLGAPRRELLPVDRLERVAGFGGVLEAPGYVYRPSTLDDVVEVLRRAESTGRNVTLRGAGRSYGDAALRAEAVVLDLSRMNRILSWDPESGTIEVEPGATIRDIWRFALGDGWWPPVVPGTMHPTLGGCLAMNVHGKNCYKAGTVGDHCLELDLLLPAGEIRTLRPGGGRPGKDGELFRAVIGSFGQLGVVTRIRWQLKRIHSGLVEVKPLPVKNLEELLRGIDEGKDDFEYAVGWMDAFARGRGLGRGQIHLARYLAPGEDPDPAQSLRLENQHLPENLFGVLPRSVMWRLAKPLTNRVGMRWVNRGKYLSARRQKDLPYQQSLAEFQFLLDYIPSWERAYPASGGLIQHQSFVPKEAAEEVFRKQIEICHRFRMPSFLAVLKRHRADDFLLSHAVDGFSLALDFPVSAGNRERLWSMVRELARPVVEAGGRFYPAKDAALTPELFQATFRDGQLERFAEIKGEADPSGLLTSSLAERLLEREVPQDEG